MKYLAFHSIYDGNQLSKTCNQIKHISNYFFITLFVFYYHTNFQIVSFEKGFKSRTGKIAIILTCIKTLCKSKLLIM